MKGKIAARRTAAWILSLMIALGTCGPVRAEEAPAPAAEAAVEVNTTEGSTEEGSTAERTAAEGSTAERAAAEGGTVKGTAAAGSTVSGSTDKGPSGSEGGEATGNLTVDGYEVYTAGSNQTSVSSIRKGKQVKLVVSVRADGLKTEEVGKKGVSVSKLSDSFRNAGAARVKVTSERDEPLEFTVTVPKTTYSGKGNTLRLKVNYKKPGIPSETVEAEISECEEYEGGSDDSETTGQPVIRVKRISPQSSIGPGDAFPLELELENTSKDSDIQDLVVNVTPGNSLFITDDTSSQIVSYIGTKQKKKITVKMTAGKELPGPSQSLDVEMKYNYYSGGNLTSGSFSQKVQIPVRGGISGQPVIGISRIGAAGPIKAGEAFNVVIRLENTSKDKDIRNLSAVMEPNDQIFLLDTTDTKQLGELKAGAAIEVPVRLQAGSELNGAASQLLGLTLKFDYDSDKGATQGSISEKIVIPTEGKGGKMNIPTPNIIIRNYSYGEKVTAGQVFDLEMEMANTSSLAAAENVVVSLETGEGISINSSSNTVYIPKLGAGEANKQTVRVQALFQSKLQSPKITITFKYEYVDGRERKQATSTETIAIPVYQPDRFELKTPVYSENFRQNEEATISVPYVNKGRGQVFNVEARLEGDINALEKDLTLGNFEAGKSGTIDFVVTPQNQGVFEGKIVVTYEDEAMQVKTEEVPLNVTVAEAQEQMTEAFNEEQEGKKGLPLIPLAAAGTALLIIIAAALKARKKGAGKEEKEEKDMGEDWEEDFFGDEPVEEAEEGDEPKQ